MSNISIYAEDCIDSQKKIKDSSVRLGIYKIALDRIKHFVPNIFVGEK